VTSLVSLSLRPDGDDAALPVGADLRAGLSLARAGSMALTRRASSDSYERSLGNRGIAPGAACALRQVHSRRVILLDDETDPAALPGVEADGMVTLRRDLVLTVTVADCLPIILHDPARGALGLVHSGWKGTGIAVDALRLMTARFGTRPADVRVTIGPGIGPCCYAVPPERAAGFAAAFGAGAVVRDAGILGAQPRLDLRRANLDLLSAVGVREFTVVGDCTCCTPALGSFRRQGAEEYVLMLAWVGWAGPAGGGVP
jgi:polyphenol oxidase